MLLFEIEKRTICASVQANIFFLDLFGLQQTGFAVPSIKDARCKRPVHLSVAQFSLCNLATFLAPTKNEIYFLI